MKSRKTRMFVALGLLVISSFSLMTISFADEYKDIQLNPNNAIQTIPTVVFKPSLDSNDKVELQNVRGKRLIQVVTNNNNFILSKNGSSKAVNSTSSSILGGDDNVLNNSNYSTIIAGEGNQINNSSHGVIGGGSGNTVIGNYGTVAGGEGNTANAYGVAVGGKLNAANGSNSVAMGYNAKANGSNSVAMGKNATVEGNNSFLWSDGTLGDDTLVSNNTFAVVGASGMVVNETKAHRFAKLTIGGSLIVRENKAVACGPDHPETIGVLKVVNRDDASNHVCFCSCDGKKWNSLFVGGACSAKCDDAFVEPQCNPSGVTKNCEGSIISYSGGCLVGNLVEGNGAFLVDNNGKLHWTCQTENGSQVQCSGDIPSKNCNDPKGHGICTGEPENAIFVESTDIKNKAGEYDNLGPTLYNKLSDVPANAKCAWYCSGGFYMEPGFSYCHKNRPCDPQEYEGYSVGFLEDTQTQEVTKPGAAVLYGTRTCTNTVVCNNKELSLMGADVCPITCNAGFDYDEASGRCYQNGVCGDEHYTCEKGTLGTTSYSEATHSWTWTCLGINGGSDNLTCSKAEDIDGVCGSEYRTCTQGDVVSATDDESKWLWTCKGYNGGEDKPCTKSKPCVEKTCPAGVYTLSSCPWGDDYCTACTPVDAQCNNGTTVYSLNSCPCGYYKNGDSCVACGAKKYSSAGASSCTTASIGYYANSSCSQMACTNKPDNAHYTSNATSNSCDWACDDGYTKSGNSCVANPVSCNCGYYNNGGTCTACGAKKYSSAGASSCSTADVGYYANSSCSQTACTNGPEHSYYTSNASTNSCSWECESGYTKNGNICEKNNSAKCTYNGSEYDVGATVNVYSSTSPTCPTTCSTVTATCQSNGTWNKTMNSSCTPKASGSCNSTTYPLTSKNVSNAKSYNTCTYYTVQSNSCKTNYRYSIDECEDGYHISSDGKSCEENSAKCTYNGSEYDVGATVNVYSSANPTCPTTCSTVTATCQSNGTWNKTMNSSCTPKASGSCNSTTYPLTSKNVSNAYSYNTCTYYTVQGTSCKANYRYSIDECNGGYHISSDGKSCEPDGCASPYVDDPSVCGELANSGKLPNGCYLCICPSGSQIFTSLDLADDAAAECSANGQTAHLVVNPQDGGEYCVRCTGSLKCTYNGSQYDVGATIDVYSSSNPTCPTNCSKVTATCQSNGQWNKTMLSSCTPKASGSCSSTTYPLTSKNVSNAKSYNTCTYYTVQSNSCKTNYRYSIGECEDGYEISSDGKSCVEKSKKCTYNGSEYDVGATVNVYSSTNPTCPTNCSTVTATCQSNGTWNKTMNSSCTPKASGSCSSTTYPLTSKNVSNAKSYNTCTYYTVQSNSCKTNYRYSIGECEDGYEISSDGKSCVEKSKKCTYNGSEYDVGATVNVYSSANPTCPTTCSTVTATCQSNGTWNKTMNSTCTPKASGSCSSTEYPLTKEEADGATEFYTCTYYTVQGNSCNINNRYAIKECETCNTTDYPLTTEGGVSHATKYAKCTSYTKNGGSCSPGSNRYRVIECASENANLYATWPSNERLGACPFGAECAKYTPYSPSSDGKSCVAGPSVYHFTRCKNGYVLYGENNCVESGRWHADYDMRSCAPETCSSYMKEGVHEPAENYECPRINEFMTCCYRTQVWHCQ